MANKTFNPNNYASLMIGDYTEFNGCDYVLIAKPNILQRVDERSWTFEQCTGEDGEPVMDGQLLIIKA